jgi:hypothetical protein
VQAYPVLRHFVHSTSATTLALLLACMPSPADAKTIGICGFDTAKYTFRGTPGEQAACLLRLVKPKGTGSSPQSIPAWLASRVGQQTKVTVGALEAYLGKANISADEIGGPASAADISDKRYFVIHDTSSPELTEVSHFPTNINSAEWPGNHLTGWADTAKRVNVIINRVGASRTLANFNAARPNAATKLEQANKHPAAKRYFLHVENIQPRIKPAGSWGHQAPEPGFSPPQLQRLALVYVAASVRAGHWLVPAFHFNVDIGMGDAHDDPQKFVLAYWVAAIQGVVTSIGETN